MMSSHVNTQATSTDEANFMSEQAARNYLRVYAHRWDCPGIYDYRTFHASDSEEIDSFIATLTAQGLQVSFDWVRQPEQMAEEVRPPIS